MHRTVRQHGDLITVVKDQASRGVARAAHRVLLAPLLSASPQLPLYASRASPTALPSTAGMSSLLALHDISADSSCTHDSKQLRVNAITRLTWQPRQALPCSCALQCKQMPPCMHTSTRR
jgi:hypothetical protein